MGRLQPHRAYIIARTGAAAMPALLPAAAVAAKLLRAAKQTVSVAESSSGGAISARLLAVPGASAYFAGGVVCYSGASKKKLLKFEPKEASATKAHAVREFFGCCTNCLSLRI